MKYVENSKTMMDKVGEMKMVKYVFLGFRNGKLETVVISNSDEVENAIDCDYFIDHPQEAKKQVETWLGETE